MVSEKITNQKGFLAYFKRFFKAVFWSNKLNLTLVLLSLFFNLTSWILLAVFIKRSEFPVPLHYNIYFGIDLTGPYRNIFNLPSIGLFVVVINFVLGFWFYSKDRIISYILLLVSLVVQIFVLIGAVTVIFINQ